MWVGDKAAGCLVCRSPIIPLEVAGFLEGSLRVSHLRTPVGLAFLARPGLRRCDWL